MEMRRKKNLPLVLTVALCLLVTVACLTALVDARKSHQRRGRDHKKHKGSHGSKYAPQPGCSLPPSQPPSEGGGGSYEPHSQIFDVLSFGAKGDGVADDTQAFQAAWKAACKVARATIEIPAEFKFLIKPLTLQGPCMPHLVLQIDGLVVAPPNLSAWPKSSLFQWINFKWLHNFTIKGTGTVDGQGSAWWRLSQDPNLQKKYKYISAVKPTALRFYGSYNVTVEDVTIINSPQCHLKFDSSAGIKISNITISSPENSPNTDGIHIQNTRDIEIHHSNIGCGDDCVSIQTGCSNVHVHDINCGPGHGISLGSLGKDNSVACVSNVTVENVSVQNALAGVRIKTWQGGRGSVRDVTFSNIQVSDVKIPIMIDQYYCDDDKRYSCKNQTRAVEIKGVKYNQITGTYSAQPLRLACSDASPCTDVDLNDIRLSPSKNARGFAQALCWNTYGQSRAPLVPASVDCLHRGGVKLNHYHALSSIPKLKSSSFDQKEQQTKLVIYIRVCEKERESAQSAVENTTSGSSSQMGIYVQGNLAPYIPFAMVSLRHIIALLKERKAASLRCRRISVGSKEDRLFSFTSKD
ncbi:hypothetical protein H6P81_009881 [Aristolochia fimbriata]|uniref:Polygalacturonase n=1 Tax=Aristolochia fimbriata TaxID=158543 RepID=A0AAV7ENA0_ARIFI|nr:hypothetical protein H6P81_009881 [Aristolochia fimbriata]